MKRLLIVITVFVIGLLAFASTESNRAHAQITSNESLTLSPAIDKLNFAAGSTKNGKIKIFNNGQNGYTVKVYAAPFSVKGEDYNPDFVTINDRTQAYQWITFQQPDYHLDAGQTADVNYTINVPENAAGGGHYAVLFAETQPTGDNGNVTRKKRVGTLLYMAIDGTTQESGQLESFTTEFWQKKAPVFAELRLKNDGNVHFQTDIDFFYRSIFGRKQFQLKKESLILPGTTRRIPIKWEKPPYFGIFKTGGSVKIFEKTEQIPEMYILLLPYPIILVAGLVILLVVSMKIIKKHKDRKTKGKGREDTSLEKE